MTTLSKSCENICTYLGKNNNALYGALTIALSKGILRPTYTMMDKKQDRQSRVYTAFREGTTGAVAFGSYLLTNHFVEKMVKPICERAKIPDKLGQVKSTLSLISVSLTALFVIPMICNLVTKPLMDLCTKKKKEAPVNNIEPLKLPNKAYNKTYQPTAYSINRPLNYGMRVGL